MGMRFKNPRVGQLENSVSEAICTKLSDEEAFKLVPFDENAVERTGYSNYSYWRSTFRAFRKNTLAMALVCIVLGILIFTFIQPYLGKASTSSVNIQPYLPNQLDSFQSNIDPKSGAIFRNLEPGTEVTLENGKLFKFILGTNELGQDLWSRLWGATRTSLLIGVAVACIEAIIGIAAGVLWGYVRKLDFFFTELYNVLDNIPQTLLLILISYVLKPGVSTIIFALSLTGWLGMARFIRNQIIIIRDRDYNLASRCLGISTGRIIVKNLLPYMVSVITMRMALAIPSAIGNEVFVTYIGIGLPVDTPSLGNLIQTGRSLMTVASLRYQLFFPVAVLVVITVSFYIIGNAFADAADPKNHVR